MSIRKRRPSFDPFQLFAHGRQGAWLEPRTGYMWQENTGVTATTSGGQTVGLLLDQSQQQQLGPELVANGDFSSGTTGWSGANAQTTLSVASGDLSFVITGAIGGGGQQTLSLVIGATYKVRATIRTSGSDFVQIAVLNNASSAFIALGSQIVSSSNTPVELYFTATETNNKLYLRATKSTGGTFGGFADNVSVVMVAGNHASQATAANRPTLQYNGDRPLIRFDGTDVLTASLPDLGGGVFSNSGSVYYVTGSAVTALHGQAIGTSYNLPGTGEDVYGYVVTPARLVPPIESKLDRYLKRLAGLA